VAGFVGTANLLAGAAAKSVVGREGTFSIRPEKITLSLTTDRAEASAEDIRAAGLVVEVIYLGSVTRFVVALDAGVQLVVAAQNRQTTFDDVARLRNQRVQLTWPAEHVIAVPAGTIAERIPEPAAHHIPAARH
jgi:putative spermidine/putrescine transport system ATP-binding protein